MDPYKVLGISAKQVKHTSDLDKVRHRAKTLFKRHSNEGKKFDAKKILEAFELVKQNLKGKTGEGQYKILGRSRKERELDRHFNHQTKEIKNNKGLKRALRHARHGTGKERIHLPGDKERIPRPRRHRHRKSRRRREREKRKKPDVNIIEGLHRLAVFLPQEQKFGKAVKLLYKWMKEYMNLENREFVFKVLDDVANCSFLVDDPDSRQDVIQVFEYLLGYYSAWFEKGLESSLFGKCWSVGAVLACKCYTDDAFVLSSTIAKLAETMELLEKHRDQIGVLPETRAERLLRAKKEEEDDKGKWKAKSEDEGDDGVKSEEDGEGSVKGELEDGGTDCKEEQREEAKGKVKPEEKAPRSAMTKPFVGMAAPVAPMASPLPSPCPMGSPSTDDAGDDDDFEVLSSGSSHVDVESEDEVLDVGSDEDDEVKEEIDLDDGESSAGEASSEGEVEEVEGSIFPVPPPGKSLDILRDHFVERCLAALFHQRGPMWARPKIDAFFQDIFYRRSVFSPAQQTQVEAWQSRIKTNQRLGDRAVGEANNPLEANRPVVDSRETRNIMDSDSNTWAGKQTFDSRESSAQRVIR